MEQQMINSLEGVETIVNGHARKMAREFGVREDIFTVHLVRRLSRGDMSIVPGPHVEIYLLWPAVQPIINSKLRSAFRLIAKRNDVWTPLAVATHAFFTKEAGESKKWIKQKLGEDVADSLQALLPKHRLEVITTKVIEVKDKITGASVMISAQTIGDYRDASPKMWSTLSQIVFDKHPETLLEPEEMPEPPKQSETPILDAALEEVRDDNITQSIKIEDE